MIRITADALVEAITIAAPARRRRGDPRRLKGQPVSITFDPDSGLMTICEAAWGLASHAVRATGHWRGRVQVSGDVLRALARTYAADEVLTLVMTRDEFSILKGDNSRISLKRLDAGGRPGVVLRPIPPNRRHKGPVAVPTDPVEKRVSLNDTWAFSARVPMPQHRKPRG
jgi:hypothetical protein